VSAFFDTSVLMAAFLAGHEKHKPCIRAVTEVRNPICALHTLAEFYANTTALPPRSRLTPEEAIFLVDQIANRFRVIALTVEEYHKTLRQMAAGHQRGGRTYDALLLACARKAEAETIYTLDHDFAELAPDLAERIATP
jgi:predicted nucleic acid-binding protein